MPSKPSIPTVCAQCSDTFLAIANRAKYGSGKYCSVECRDTARRGVVLPKLPKQPNRVCERCGTEFWAKPAIIKAGGARFCNWECKSAAEESVSVLPDDVRDVIYMAGLVDGEGTITAVEMYSRTTGHLGLSYRILLSNTHAPVMDWIVQTFGGRHSKPRPTQSPLHKPITTWYIGASAAVALCERLLPYLKIKRRHAEIILALSHLSYERAGRAGRYLSPETRAARVPLLTELRALNHRGRKVQLEQLSFLE